MRLRLWPHKKPRLLLDPSPTAEEEERNLFDNPVHNPKDLNEVILRERVQDMDQRIIFADRAFVVTLVWIVFLVTFPFAQMVATLYGVALSDAAFIAVITTTTASVFGYWLLVGRYLFAAR